MGAWAAREATKTKKRISQNTIFQNNLKNVQQKSSVPKHNITARTVPTLSLGNNVLKEVGAWAAREDTKSKSTGLPQSNR